MSSMGMKLLVLIIFTSNLTKQLFLCKAADFAGACSMIYRHKQRFVRTIREASVAAAPTVEEIKE